MAYWVYQYWRAKVAPKGYNNASSWNGLILSNQCVEVDMLKFSSRLWPYIIAAACAAAPLATARVARADHVVEL
ncbi:MAG: hypothetical protein ACRET9_06405, partial [Burkholderiales bacterium]